MYDHVDKVVINITETKEWFYEIIDRWWISHRIAIICRGELFDWIFFSKILVKQYYPFTNATLMNRWFYSGKSQNQTQLHFTSGAFYTVIEENNCRGMHRMIERGRVLPILKKQSENLVVLFYELVICFSVLFFQSTIW